MRDIKEFIHDRNNALFSFDRNAILAFQNKYGIPHDECCEITFWAGVCKAICEIKCAPPSIRARAVSWLDEHGMGDRIFSYQN